MTESEKLALEILETLKDSKPATRDRWKAWALDEFSDDPGTINFVNQVYSMANE